MTGRISDDPPASVTTGISYAAIQGGINVRVPQSVLNTTIGSATVGNLCLNPIMQMWGVDTSIAAAPHRSVGAVGWLFGTQNGSSVFTLERSTDVPTGSGFPYSLKLDCTTADTSPANNSERHLRYAIYGYGLSAYQTANIRVRFWVKSGMTGIHSVACDNENRDRTYLTEYTIAIADTWEQHEVAIPLSSKTGSWNFGDGYGLGLRWAISVGADYRAVPGSWQVGNFVGTPSQVNVASSTANNFFITGVEIYADVLPFQFQVPDFEDVFRDSLRQYRVITAKTGGVPVVFGIAPDVDSVNFDLPIEPMYVPPTVTTKGTLGTDLDAQGMVTPSSPLGVTSITSFARSQDYAKFSATKTGGFTAGLPYQFRLITTTGKIVVDGHLA